VVNLFDASGHAVVQEVASERTGRPEKRLFLAPDGSVTAQCVDTDGNGTLDARATVQNGVVTEVLIDTHGKGVANQREIWRDGQRVELQADTNGDHKVDVVQRFENGVVVQQDEDTNFDGILDRRFVGKKPAPIPPGTPVPGPPLGPLDCGRFSDAWRAR
jgi:hypothetical protein